jgi:hypothetical protein
LPWNLSSIPQVLYKLNSDEITPISLLPYCFPNGINSFTKLYSRQALLMEHIFKIPQLELFTLYFPTFEEAPFFYCCRFPVNNFSCPSLAHSFSYEILFPILEERTLFSSEVCIIIQSNFQLKSYFFHYFNGLRMQNLLVYQDNSP